MPLDLSAIDTIVILMMENRSFDHVLGYLSLAAAGRTDVEGLSADQAWREQFANTDAAGVLHLTNRLPSPDNKLVGDPPHERDNVATQLGPPAPRPAGPVYPMNGFVRSFGGLDPRTGNPIAMGHFTGEQVPTTDFFAANYAICDQWFSSLPAGTQPNRLMSMSGHTRIDVNSPIVLPEQDLVYDWLTRKGVSWRVYHDGLPFFALMPKWIGPIAIGNDFRAYNRLRLDWKQDEAVPQVIFIEPRYTDAPHIEAPADDHAPSPISSGQRYLMRVHDDLRSNPARWERTVLIVTYDEHGGFFDHVSPPAIRTVPPADASWSRPFESLGVRVPAYVISPLVEPGSVHHGVMDHLSVLKLLGQKFNGGSYSPEVDARPVGSVADVLDAASPQMDPAQPVETEAGFTPQAGPTEPTPLAFAAALDQLRTQHPAEAEKRFPELLEHF